MTSDVVFDQLGIAGIENVGRLLEETMNFHVIKS